MKKLVILLVFYTMSLIGAEILEKPIVVGDNSSNLYCLYSLSVNGQIGVAYCKALSTSPLANGEYLCPDRDTCMNSTISEPYNITSLGTEDHYTCKKENSNIWQCDNSNNTIQKKFDCTGVDLGRQWVTYQVLSKNCREI